MSSETGSVPDSAFTSIEGVSTSSAKPERSASISGTSEAPALIPGSVNGLSAEYSGISFGAEPCDAVSAAPAAPTAPAISPSRPGSDISGVAGCA